MILSPRVPLRPSLSLRLDTGILLLAALLVWLALTTPGHAQESKPVYHLTLVPGQERTLSELVALYQADLAQAIYLNRLEADQRLKAEQAVILPIPVDIALAQGHVSIVRHIAAPGQSLAMVAAILDLPGPLLSDMNNMALDDRLFPGQPILIPVPVRTTPRLTIGRMKVEYLSPLVAQGSTGFIAVTLPKGLEAELMWQGETIRMSSIAAAGIQSEQRLLAPLPVHPLAIPAQRSLHISYVNHQDVRVTGKIHNEVFAPNSYKFETIEIPTDIAERLNAQELKAEQDILARVWSRFSPGPWPSSGWQRPVDPQFSTSSPFGSRRTYISDTPYPYNFHSGQDYAAVTGSQVLAAAAGTVIFTDPLLTKGQTLIIDHGQGVLTGYWHLSQVLVQPGDLVQANQVVGLVGNSGISTGAHLHWELRIQGIPVDPLQFLTEPLVPPEAQQ